MAENVFIWDTTAANNDDADPAVPWPEGMLPGAVNNAARSLMSGVARMLKDFNGTVATTGSANAYAATSNSGHTAYANGIRITVRANFTNTAAATLNLNTYGAKNIRVFGTGGEVAVAAGQIQSGGTYDLRYDSAADSASGAFILLNPSPDATAQFNVGNIKVVTSDTLETGWLWCNGLTIGDASSGATALASALASPLFVSLWTNFANSELAVSGGRGASAAADFAAHKTIALPDLCGRAVFGSDDMGGITLKGRITHTECLIAGTTLGYAGGLQSVTLSTGNLPSHTHTGTSDSGGAHTHALTTASTVSAGAHTHTAASAGDHSHTSSAGENFVGIPGGVLGSLTGLTVSPGAYAPRATNTTGAHTHTTDSQGAHTHTLTGTTDTDGSHTHAFTTAATGSGTTHNNMPPALILNYIVKY